MDDYTKLDFKKTLDQLPKMPNPSWGILGGFLIGAGIASASSVIGVFCIPAGAVVIAKHLYDSKAI